MANPSLSSNTSTITIICIPSQADNYHQKYDAEFNAANNYTQTFTASVLSMYGEDVFFIKTTLPSKIYKCKFDQVVIVSL